MSLYIRSIDFFIFLDGFEDDEQENPMNVSTDEFESIQLDQQQDEDEEDMVEIVIKKTD